MQEEEMTSIPETAAVECPAWADVLIRQIHVLEVRLGNLIDPEETWKSTDVQDVLANMLRDEDNAKDDEVQVEALFRRIVRGLSAEGHAPGRIAGWINARVGFGGRLPYCDENEVLEAIRADN